jgi:hypothetical protein
MFTLKIENENEEIITLTGRESRYQVLNIEGLSPPNANVRRSSVAGMDGSKYMSSKLEERNVVLTIRINGKVEENRLQLYRWFKTKHWCKVYYTNGTRNVYIEGYIEATECNLFTSSEIMQISIICPDPYWLSAQEIVTDVSQVLALFEFPFAFGAKGIIEDTITDDAIEFSQYVENRLVTIINDGEDDTGMLIEITASGDVINPVIFNVDTRDFFRINMTLEEGDLLTIDTNKGQKSILLHRGVDVTNKINKVIRDSTWLTISKGENHFTYEADEGSANMHITFTHRTKYQGV